MTTKKSPSALARELVSRGFAKKVIFPNQEFHLDDLRKIRYSNHDFQHAIEVLCRIHNLPIIVDLSNDQRRKEIMRILSKEKNHELLEFFKHNNLRSQFVGERIRHIYNVILFLKNKSHELDLVEKIFVMTKMEITNSPMPLSFEPKRYKELSNNERKVIVDTLDFLSEEVLKIVFKK